MTAYINRLIAVMVVCQIATIIAPDAENAKRSIRSVCALVSLLTLLSPLSHLFSISDNLTEKITAFFTMETSQTYDEKEAGAASILQYVTERYGIDELSVVIVTDESDTEVTEIRFFIEDCPYAARAVLESELSEAFKLPVYVFSE